MYSSCSINLYILLYCYEDVLHIYGRNCHALLGYFRPLNDFGFSLKNCSDTKLLCSVRTF